MRAGRRCCVVVLTALSVLAYPASAKPRWGKPAAGQSRSGDPEIVFTFDDGPHERYTQEILDELAMRNIQAIFYWVGRRVKKRGRKNEQRVNLVERAVVEGHIVANHTIHHVHLCSVNASVAKREIDENARIYEALTGLPQIMFRAPYGDHCPRLLAMLGERNLDHMHWDIDPQDWENGSSEETAAEIIRKLKRLEGRVVVLMHDTHLTSVRALPMVLDWIDKENSRRRKQGKAPYRILSGSDLAVEKLSTPIGHWTVDTARAARGSLVDALGRLIPGYPPSAVSRR